jgi:hypothetical protein
VKLLNSGKHAKAFGYLGRNMSLALDWLPIETQTRNKQQYEFLRQGFARRDVAFRIFSPRAPGIDSVRFRCF